MKSAILSDIHSNITALEAVLRDIDGRGGVDQYWCLGDIIDYGPDPHECLERVAQLNAITVIGNHEYAITGQMDLKEFQTAVMVVTRWTRDQLSPDEIAYLKSLPPTLTTGAFTLAHGSPRDPIMEYIMSETCARQNLSYLNTRYCLTGHTHMPLYFQISEGDPEAETEKSE